VFFFSFVTSVVWGIIHYPAKIGCFLLNVFVIEVLDPSYSLLLYCVVLVTFDLLNFYIVTVCKDDLWRGGFVGTAR